jgi:hypothetical protein
LLWKWIAASSSEKGNKNHSLSAKIMSYGPKSDRLEISPDMGTLSMRYLFFSKIIL